MVSFLEFMGLSAIAAAALSVIAHLFKQPAILGFIVLGFFASVYLGNSVPHSLIEDTSLFGISLLLFLIGTELNLEKVRKVGKESLMLGISQVIFTTIAGFFIAHALGFSALSSFLMALAMSFCSTVVIVKLLSDKHDLESLYGRLALGMLLVQDVIAVSILIFMGASNFYMFASAILVFAALFIAGYFFSPHLFNTFKQDSEALFFLSLAWIFIFIFTAKAFGLGVEIPAILAGMSLAATPQVLEISRRLKPLKDLFLVFFFISLGSSISFSSQVVVPAIALSLFILIANPLIAFFILNVMGYHNRVAFETGLMTAQISEFSLVMMLTASRLEYVGTREVATLGLVGMITFFISTYFISYNSQIYERFKKILQKIAIRKKNNHDIQGEGACEDHIILVGFHRIGYILAQELKGENLLVVEFNPELASVLKEEKFHFIVGDIIDADMLDRVHISGAKLIISTIPHEEENAFLIAQAKSYHVPVIATAMSAEDALQLYRMGADYVIVPHFLGGEYSAALIKKTLRDLDFSVRKERHILEIQEKLKKGHF